MNRKEMSFLAVLLCGAVLGTAGPLQAQNVLDQLFRPVEADPDATYALTEDAGPWLIMACGFSGEGAAQQANELVYEFRKRYKLAAYVHQMEFDYGEVHSRCFSRYGGLRKARYYRGDDFEEIAVLVGDFPDVDDPKAQATLEKIKYAHPECLKLSKGEKTNVTLAGWRTVVKMYSTKEKQKKGPMGNAFVIPNPLKPKQFFSPGGVDQFVERMNKNVEHGLLDCPGKYTVQVATFAGSSQLKEATKLTEKDLAVDPEKTKLDDAALKAHQVVVALRAKGWEAYEFHDRYASIVTVGSFDSVGTPRQDGKIEINPQIHKIMLTFAGQPLQPGSVQAAVPNLGVAPQTIDGVALDVQPKPVLVPRRSIGADYARGVTRP